MLESIVKTHDLRPRDVAEFEYIEPEFLKLITDQEDVESDNFLFLDIETSGLSVGAGNLIYLIGFGSIKGGSFELRQYLINDLAGEQELIRKTIDELDKARMIVTFNGKSFDLPVIEGRMRYYGYSFEFEFHHLDLLNITRSLLPLDGYSLKKLEIDQLGLYREDDVPSKFIPELFLRYVENKDPELSETILKHNEYDILAMAHLLLELHTAFQDRSNPRVIYQLGRLYEKTKDYEKASDCYQQVMNFGIDYELELLVMKRLAMLYKKAGRTEETIEILNALLAHDDPFPYLELAKHYEHKVKNYKKAYQLTEQAIDLFPKLKPKLLVRLNRLMSKDERIGNS